MGGAWGGVAHPGPGKHSGKGDRRQEHPRHRRHMGEPLQLACTHLGSAAPPCPQQSRHKPAADLYRQLRGLEAAAG